MYFHPIIPRNGTSFNEEGDCQPALKKTLDKNVLKNYGPVSNLPSISKIVEKIVSSQLLDHIESNNLGESLQSAYKLHLGTETTRLKFDLWLAMDDHKASLVVFLDLSPAFDTIDHTILVNILRNDYGLCEKYLIGCNHISLN